MTGQPHILNHGVTEDEVEEVLWCPADEFPGRGDSRIVLGSTESGRHLHVVSVRNRTENSVFVITARELTGKPLLAYRRRRRKR